jgi:hypothetical protein
MYFIFTIFLFDDFVKQNINTEEIYSKNELFPTNRTFFLNILKVHMFNT